MTEPSGYTALDLIGFTDKGEYNAATNYVRNDLAHVGNDVWRCLADDTTGVTPAEGAYWTIFIENDSTASNVGYTNTTSGLAATNVQNAIDELASEKADSATTLAGYGISDAYTSTQTDNAISTAINALDVSDSAVSGSYVTAVSETDGKVNVTREAADNTPTASSTKMVTSGGVKTALDAKMSYADNGVLGAKNLIPITLSNLKALNVLGTWSSNVYSYNGIDYTVVMDNSSVSKITAIGTASDSSYMVLANIDFGNNKISTAGTTTANGYTISGGISSTQFCQYNNANRITSINIANGEVISASVSFYPMIRLASDTDSTYQPYAETNKQLTKNKMSYKDNGVLGAKNLLKNTATTQVINGVTFTVNDNKSITTSGSTSSGGTCYVFNSTSNPIVLSEPCIFSMGNNLPNTVVCYAVVNGNNYYVNNSQKEIELPSGNLTSVYIYFNASHSTAVTFYPMIRIASDSDDTYQPYAMTNRELTEKVAPIACEKTTAGTYTLTATVDSNGNVTYTWA